MNQAQLRKMAQERIIDAQALLAAGRWPFAYYVAGYAVECALKSCVLAQMVNTGWVFREKLKGDECRTHDFNKLIDIAGMRPELILAGQTRHGFTDRWNTVEKWSETSRYDDGTDEATARALCQAITHDPDGVLL